MSRVIGNELTETLYERLLPSSIGRNAGRAIPICTIDEKGWPHPAMLSYMEAAAVDRKNVRICCNAGSTTAGNLRRNGRLTMLIVDERGVYYLKGTASELAPSMKSSPSSAMFNIRIDQLVGDEPDNQTEAGARVLGGITYEHPDMSGELERARAVLDELVKS